MSSHEWEITPKGCGTHAASFVQRDPSSRQPNNLWEIGGVRAKAWIKWDGCVEYENTFNSAYDSPYHKDEDEQGIHICDIDAFVADLLALKEAAMRYFNGELGVGGVPNDDVLSAIGRTITDGPFRSEEE
jgi:hypothetical protein